MALVLRTLTYNNNNYYPVRICTAGLCVWSRPFVYIFIYTGAYEPPKAAKEHATRDRLWVPSEYNQIHSSQQKTSLLGIFCASLNMCDGSYIALKYCVRQETGWRNRTLVGVSVMLRRGS